MEMNNLPDWKSIVYRGIESDELDYKSSMNWILLPRSAKAKFVRHCMALANTKGGFIVVGVQEDAAGHPSVYKGLSEEESRSFDPSTVGSFINKFVDPAIDFTIERPIIDGKRYAIFVVTPFSQMPHVCTSGLEDELKQGVFYIRTPDASSRPAYRASEIHRLIQRALRNQRELLAQMLRGILYETNNALSECETENASRFDEEIFHAQNFFNTRTTSVDVAQKVTFELFVHPQTHNFNSFSLDQARNTLDMILHEPQNIYILNEKMLSESYFTNTAMRMFKKDQSMLFQFGRSGLLYYIKTIPHGHNSIDYSYFKNLITQSLYLSSDFYHHLPRQNELMNFKIVISNLGDLTLKEAPENYTHPGIKSNITMEIQTSAEKLYHDRDKYLPELLNTFLNNFIQTASK